MGKTNYFDEALNGVEELVNEVSQSISDDFQGSQPFDSVKVDNEKLLQAYTSLTPEDILYLMQKHPPDVVADFRQDMEKLLTRRQGNGR